MWCSVCSALDDFWVARLGALRRGTDFASPYEQLRPLSAIVLHPGYVDAGFVNDISLLRMREPVRSEFRAETRSLMFAKKYFKIAIYFCRCCSATTSAPSACRPPALC